MRRMVMAALVLVVGGCATLHNRNELRGETLEGYAAALRWGGLANGWSFVDPSLRAAHPMTDQQKALYGKVKVAEYAAAAPVITGPDTIEQTVRISLIVNASQRVRAVVDRQRWRWDPQAKRWWLESGLPDVGVKDDPP